ncbi:hypothetical protein PoB_005294400 [Plakobranchus ocellatus]|uniref:Uncharacterized protein n=1 Tax=Plakobranchus ocellatus TaxID=259542 RepID=A0AAV4C5W8_9GAST|nr:hypothetical protein PoB_005294400 [Plakobranchus ocellatus]
MPSPALTASNPRRRDDSKKERELRVTYCRERARGKTPVNYRVERELSKGTSQPLCGGTAGLASVRSSPELQPSLTKQVRRPLQGRVWFGFRRKPLHNKLTSGFQVLRQARALVAGLEPKTKLSLHISGRIRYPLCHRRLCTEREMGQGEGDFSTPPLHPPV